MRSVWSFLRECWGLLRFIHERHPLVIYAGIIFLLVSLFLIIALFKGSRFHKPVYARKGRRTVLPFLLVLALSCGIPPVLWYVGRITPAETIVKKQDKYVFGIDVSHYQGWIDWNRVKQSKHPIRFVLIRASMGTDGADLHYPRNWEQSSRAGYLRGAYHFFRPDEPAGEQFLNFRSRVNLRPGDLPPVLDVEALGNSSPENIRKAVLEWLRLAQEAYKIRPIVYTGRNFYLRHLKGHVDGYPLWIAAYDGEHRVSDIPWKLHQFTDAVRVLGIREPVDGNNFRGSEADLRQLCLK